MTCVVIGTNMVLLETEIGWAFLIIQPWASNLSSWNMTTYREGWVVSGNSDHFVPGTIVGFLHVWTHWIHTVATWGKIALCILQMSDPMAQN